MNKNDYQSWAFRFTIWIFIINLITMYFTITYVDFPGMQSNYGLGLFYFGILASILLLLSVVFIIISTIRKEKKDYKYWISIAGIIFFGVLPLLESLIQF